MNQFPINRYYSVSQQTSDTQSNNSWVIFRDLYKILMDHGQNTFALIKPVYKQNQIVDFCFIDVNQSLLIVVNKTRDQMIGESLLNEFPRLTGDEFFPEFVRSFERKEAYFHEYEIHHPETNSRDFFRMEVYPLDNLLAVINTNTTEQYRAASQVTELQFEKERVRLMQEVIREAGHDIRTPLMIIGTSVHLAEKSVETDEIQKSLVNVRAQVKHINAIIEDLVRLTYWKNDSSYSKMKILPIIPFVTRIASDMQLLASLKNQSVSLEFKDECCSLIDEEKMYRAIMNIMKNAINYTPEWGAITVSTMVENNHVVISVTDNGIGISEEHLESIFDRFYRVSDDKVPTEEHSGLGLTISRYIVEAHAGYIKVSSKLGEGSTFKIVLPYFPLDIPTPY